MFPPCGALSALLCAGSSSSAFGPDYWLARCDGFHVIAVNGSRGEVDEIVEIDGVIAELRVSLGGENVRAEPAGVLDIDPVGRVLSVSRTAAN